MRQRSILARIALSAAAAAAVWVASGCGGEKIEYARFEDPQRAFTVELPASIKMTETARWQEDLTLDTRATCIQYDAVSDEVTYRVGVMLVRVGDFLPGATPDSRARQMVESGLKAAGFSEYEISGLERGGIPVIRARAERLKDGQRLVGIAESYIMRGESLLVMVVATKDAAQENPSVAHFFESFRPLGIPIGP